MPDGAKSARQAITSIWIAASLVGARVGVAAELDGMAFTVMAAAEALGIKVSAARGELGTHVNILRSGSLGYTSPRDREEPKARRKPRYTT